MTKPEWVGWNKIPRLEGETMVVSEKLDGTSGQILITEDEIWAGSRNRWITPDDDNFGFATWVAHHEGFLRELLGTGRHFGEWWGAGIQRKYGLSEKRFYLFNTYKYRDIEWPSTQIGVVPVLYEGPVSFSYALERYDDLKDDGSVAAPGFVNPEGVCVYLAKSKTYYKVTDAVQGQKHQET